jgi:hypothetical protein
MMANRSRRSDVKEVSLSQNEQSDIEMGAGTSIGVNNETELLPTETESSADIKNTKEVSSTRQSSRKSIVPANISSTPEKTVGRKKKTDGRSKGGTGRGGRRNTKKVKKQNEKYIIIHCFLYFI